MTSSSHIRRIALTTAIGCAGLAGSASSATARPIDFWPPTPPAATEPTRQAADAGLPPAITGIDVRTLQLTLRYGPDTLTNVDLGASGTSVGDRLVFAADAFRGDQRIGVGAGECIIVRYRPADTHLDHCAGTLSLPQGQITVQWLVDRIRDPRPTKVALTGGTGAYRTAHGEMLVSAPDAQGIEPLTLRLMLDHD